MTHWGWYWKVKMKHKPRRSCSNVMSIDSFEMFKNKIGTEMCMNKVAYQIPEYNLKAFLYEDHYFVGYTPAEGYRSYYKIPIEKQACNYGGFRYFFHCPKCGKRMRMLYHQKGRFLCRKCMNLGYFTQRLCPSTRILIMSNNIEKLLEARGGSLYKKPPRMKQRAFKKLQDRHFEYRHVKQMAATRKELLEYYPSMRAEIEKYARL